MKYIIPVEVKSAEGAQEFLVEAETKQKAIDKFLLEGGKMINSEVEVTSLELPDISAVYESKE